MTILFFLLIFIQLMFALIIIKRLSHPIILLKIFCSVSTLILIPFSKIWNIDISASTVLIFTTALLWIDLGFFITSYLSKPKLQNPEINKLNFYYYSPYKAFFFFLVNLSILLIYLRHGNEIINYGSFEELSKSILYFKVEQRDGDLESISGMGYLMNSATVIGAVYVYVFINEILRDRFSFNKIVFLLPSIVTLLLNFFTGRRSFLLIIIIMGALLTFEWLLRKYKHIPLRLQIKVFLLGLVSCTIFYLFFTTLGDMYGKGSENTFAVYLSGGVASFNEVYKDYIFTSEEFGQNTFRFFYVLLNLLPGADFAVDTIKESYYHGNGFVTNVYTFNLHYMADFAYAGIMLNNFFIGVVYAYMYVKSKNEEMIGFWNVILAFYMINLFSYLGAEKFYVSMTLNLQQLILFMLLLKTPILRKNKIKYN